MNKKDQVYKAIKIFENEVLVDKESIITSLKNSSIDEVFSIDIYLFLPMVFCKKLLPKIVFPDTYYEDNGLGKIVKKKYSQTKSYLIIEEVVDQYFKQSPNSKLIMKIASISAEFNAINELLINGGKIENVKLTEATILR